MYKDLARWLIGFVPVTTLLGLGVAVAPAAAQTYANGPSWVMSVSAIIVLVVMVSMLIACCGVLLSTPTARDALLGDEKWMSEAFSDHSIGRPHYLDSTQFSRDRLACQLHPGDSREHIVEEVISQLLALSGDQNVKKRFTYFSLVFFLGSPLIIAGVLAVFISTSSVKDTYVDPTVVSLHIPQNAITEFTKMTGCSSTSTTKTVAVGGTGAKPELRLFGPGCKGSSWLPESSLGILATTQ